MADYGEGPQHENGPRDLWPDVRAKLRALDLLNEDDTPKDDGPRVTVTERRFDPVEGKHGKTLLFTCTGHLMELSPRGYGEDGQSGRLVINQEGTPHPVGFADIDNIELA